MLLVVVAALLVCDVVLLELELELFALVLGALADCVLVEDEEESLDFVAESPAALPFCGLLAAAFEPLDAAGALFELVAGALFELVAGALFGLAPAEPVDPVAALVCCVWPACGLVADSALGNACGPKTMALAANSETKRCAQRRAGLEPRGWSGTAITRRAADLWRPSPCLVSIEWSPCFRLKLIGLL